MGKKQQILGLNLSRQNASLSLPGAGEKDSIYTTECGHGHENRDHKREVSIEFLGECLKNIERVICTPFLGY